MLEARFARGIVDFLNDLFAPLIFRVRFAGKNELHRPFSILNEAEQSLLIGKEERTSLIGRKPSSKTDGQHVRIKYAVDLA